MTATLRQSTCNATGMTIASYHDGIVCISKTVCLVDKYPGATDVPRFLVRRDKINRTSVYLPF
jgi:hypothetical protein